MCFNKVIMSSIVTYSCLFFRIYCAYDDCEFCFMYLCALYISVVGYDLSVQCMIICLCYEFVYSTFFVPLFIVVYRCWSVCGKLLFCEINCIIVRFFLFSMRS
jgi:hypothetical protein